MQGVLVFASAAARNAAITSPQEGQFAYTKDTNGLWYYDGAAWVASGATGDIEGVTAGVGISGGGTSGTVTITNDMATTITAAGDIVVGTGSGTYDNLPIGTTAQVLTADTTVSPYKVKWATPAASSSGLTLIQRSSFSNVATTSTTFDGVFTSTYKQYIAIAETLYAGTDTNTLILQLRYAGPTTQASTYFGANFAMPSNSAVVLTGSHSASGMGLATATGASTSPSAGQITFGLVGNSSQKSRFYGTWVDNNGTGYSFGGLQDTARTYTGFILSASASNITGTISVYGLATA
jgi:hypothetical protein